MQTNIDELLDWILSSGLPRPRNAIEEQFAVTLYRLLAEGAPLSRQALAQGAGIGVEVVNAAWDQIAGLVTVDDAGNIVAFGGFTVSEETRHQIRIGDQDLHTWCAFDTLFIPALVGKPARIRSTCPQTQQIVEVHVSAEDVRAEPKGAYVSISTPNADERGADFRRWFCEFVHFFASDDAAHAWQETHGSTELLTVDDAFALARRFNAIAYANTTGKA